MLHLAATHYNACIVEKTISKRFIFNRWNKIVQSTQLTITFYASIGIGVYFVVENLKFATNRRTTTLVQLGINKVFDTAISTFGNFKIDTQLEVFVFFDGYNIATIGRFATIGF